MISLTSATVITRGSQWTRWLISTSWSCIRRVKSAWEMRRQQQSSHSVGVKSLYEAWNGKWALGTARGPLSYCWSSGEVKSAGVYAHTHIHTDSKNFTKELWRADRYKHAVETSMEVSMASTRFKHTAGEKADASSTLGGRRSNFNVWDAYYVKCMLLNI